MRLPLGVGGWLSYMGSPQAWFAGSIGKSDVIILKAPWGASDSQQVFEALAVLIAFKAWPPCSSALGRY